MLEPPDIPDADIAACLRDQYGLNAVEIAFLPLGADRNTAVYRAVTDTAAFFVKLRGGAFDDATVRVPKLLHDRGIQQVIAPLPTFSQQLCADLGDFKLTVFPFVEGRNGYEVDLLNDHWIELGRAVKALHTAELPAALTDRIPREQYSNRWCERVKQFQQQVESAAFADPVSAELAAFLKRERDSISELVSRAETFAAMLQTRPQAFLLCHGDLHAGNVLIDAHNRLFVVDWDTLILAPKERDLMFVGGMQFGSSRLPEQEEALFYRGYGAAPIDVNTRAYYRCERIVQDIAEFCAQILLTDERALDRQQALRWLTGQFQPGHLVDMTLKSEA